MTTLENAMLVQHASLGLGKMAATAITAEPVQAFGEAHPSIRLALAPPPNTLQCLRCQLLGRRRLTCSRADACRAIPHFYPLGPVLLAAWLATAVAFVIAVM